MKKKLESLVRTKYFWGIVVLVVLIIIGCIIWGVTSKKDNDTPNTPVEEEGGLTVMETDDGSGDSIDFEDVVEEVKNKDGVVLEPGKNAHVVSDGNGNYHLEDDKGNPGIDSNGNVVNTDKDGNPTSNGDKTDDKKPGSEEKPGSSSGDTSWGPLF